MSYHLSLQYQNKTWTSVVYYFSCHKKKGNKSWILLASCKHLCWSLEHCAFEKYRIWSKLDVIQPGRILAEKLPLTTPNITKAVKATVCSHSPQCELLNGLSAAVNSSYKKAITLQGSLPIRDHNEYKINHWLMSGNPLTNPSPATSSSIVPSGANLVTVSGVEWLHQLSSPTSKAS